MKIIGLMSGTSLDGCDAALVSIENEQTHLLSFLTWPMPDALRQRIMDGCSLDRSNTGLLCSLNVELGRWFAEAALALCDQAGVPIPEITCIGSHGQTLFHIPEPTGEWIASTLQLGDPATIAYTTGVPVISDFRAMDMAAGGRGAPLVPYVDFLLYRADHGRALQNIGGIGNVTVLPARCTLDEVFAFDTGPGNMIIDELARRFFGLPYDEGGRIAAKGQVDVALLHEWMAVPFVDAPPPKATGRELYGTQFVSEVLTRHPHVAPEDLLATATRYTAATIARNLRLHVLPRCAVEELILSGGGSHNLTLSRDLAALLPECALRTQEELGWSSDAKEAVAFALLAYTTLRGMPGNVPGATGANRPVILGQFTPAPDHRVPLVISL